MTITYSIDVLDTKAYAAVFVRLLFRWKGSVWKCLWLEAFKYTTLYTIVLCIYTFGLNEHQQMKFQYVINRSQSIDSNVPVSLVLGFHTNFVFSYFWSYFCHVPWVIRLVQLVVVYLPSNLEEDKQIRCTITRYVCVSVLMVFTEIDNPILKKKFPDEMAYFTQGYLTKEEIEILGKIPHPKFRPFIPLVWATSLLTKAERDKKITNHDGLVRTIGEIQNIYNCLIRIVNVELFPIPHVYRHLVSFAVHMYFVNACISRQYIVLKSVENYQMGISIFTIIEFIVIMGWHKIAKSLTRPVGEDDDHFDFEEFHRYNWVVGMSIAEASWNEPPELCRDTYWGKPARNITLTQCHPDFMLGESQYNLASRVN